MIYTIGIITNRRYTEIINLVTMLKRFINKYPDINIVLQYQEKEKYLEAFDVEDSIDKFYTEGFTHGGNRENLIETINLHYPDTTHICLMDDDIINLGSVIHGDKFGIEDKSSLFEDNLHQFIIESSEYLEENKDVAYVAPQQRFMMSNPVGIKHSKCFGSCLAVWRINDLIKYFKECLSIPYLRLHGDDLYLYYAIKRDGLVTAKNTNFVLNVKAAGTPCSTMRPDNSYSILSAMDTLLVLSRFQRPIRVSKTKVGYFSPRESTSDSYDMRELLHKIHNSSLEIYKEHLYSSLGDERGIKLVVSRY